MKKGFALFLFISGLFFGSAQSTGKYQIKFLEINKKNSDYGLAILDNNKLVFSSAYEKAKSSRKNYNPKKDLYVGEIDFDGEIKNVKPILTKDSKFNQTGLTFTSDKKTVYFSRNPYAKKRSKQRLRRNQRLDLYKASVKPDGSWDKIEKLPFSNKAYSTGFPVLNKDNTKLYFVSDRSPSLGKTDIFVVDILKDGTYSEPRNLGPNVNTKGKETTPFITEDNILYFSSDGHPGKGKLDVFAVEVYENSTSEIYTLSSPINSINNDFAYIINKDENQGFFTSNRLQGGCYNDLYSFTLEKDVRPGECFILVDGKVKDKDSKEVISGATVDLYDMEGKLLESIYSYDDGSFKFTVSCAKEYKLVASNENYSTDEKQIEILEENYHSALHTNMNLSKLKEDKLESISEVGLQPIFYDFNDATIKSEAAKELDRVAKIMKDNPNLILEASAFTDSRGSNSYNLKLSNSRAKAAKEYLEAQGIESDRIKGVGYGEEKLKNQCVNGIECDENAHQINRRTEFNFINTQASIDPVKTVRKKRPKLKKKKPIKSDNKRTLVAENKLKYKEPSAEIKVKERKETKYKEEIINKDKEVKIASVETKTKLDKQSVKPESNQASNPKKNLEELVKDYDIVIGDYRSKSKPAPQPKKEKHIAKKSTSKSRAKNYIEEQKTKIIDKLIDLEQRYQEAISSNNENKDSLIIYKENIITYKESVAKVVETGWVDILVYRNDVAEFAKKYNRLVVDQQNLSLNKNNKSDKGGFDEKNLLSFAERRDKRILEKNLKVNDLQVVAMKVNANGKYLETTNPKKAEIIKVSFKLKQNKNVSPGQKDAYLVLQNPKGRVSNAKGVFIPKDKFKAIKFTDHTVINYNNNDVDVVMFVEKKGNNNFEKGNYPLELFVEGELVAIANLNL